MSITRSNPIHGIVRQGDVLLVPVEVRPTPLRELKRRGGRLVLAEGEVTGHAHAVLEPTARLMAPIHYTSAARLRFLVIEGGPATVVHEEHDPITLGPGTYEVVRQREYQPQTRPQARSWRQVAD